MIFYLFSQFGETRFQFFVCLVCVNMTHDFDYRCDKYLLRVGSNREQGRQPFDNSPLHVQVPAYYPLTRHVWWQQWFLSNDPCRLLQTHPNKIKSNSSTFGLHEKSATSLIWIHDTCPSVWSGKSSSSIGLISHRVSSRVKCDSWGKTNSPLSYNMAPAVTNTFAIVYYYLSRIRNLINCQIPSLISSLDTFDSRPWIVIAFCSGVASNRSSLFNRAPCTKISLVTKWTGKRIHQTHGFQQGSRTFDIRYFTTS